MIGFLGALKKMGYPVKLDTNGSRPEAIQALLEKGLVDYLAVDVKADPERYPASIADKCESARIEKTIALVFGARQKGMVEAEFRTTCFSPVVSEKVIMDIAARLKGAIPLYLQAFRSGEVLNPALVSGAGAQPDKETLARWALKASALLPCRVR